MGDEPRERPGEAIKAMPVIVSDSDTDYATGHCECSNCREPIDPWDKYCRHCGAEMEREA